MFRHPTTGKRIAYSTNHVYDPVSQVAVIRIYYEPVDDPAEPSRMVVLSQRKFFPAELEALVVHAGLSVEHRYGDFVGEPLTGEAESQLLVCRVPPPSDTRR